MSSSILEDSVLDIEVSLIKKARVNEGGEIVPKIVEIFPITLSALTNIVIEDSLTQHGLKGTITVNNKGHLLSKLGITSGTPEDLYIRFNIIDKELEKSDVGEVRAQSKLSFLGMVRSTTSASANFEDNIVTFEFEEAAIAEMKYTSWDVLFKDNPDFNENESINVIELVDAFYKQALSQESGLVSITLPPKDSNESLLAKELFLSYGLSEQNIEDVSVRSAIFSDTPSIKIPYYVAQDVEDPTKDSKVFDVFKKFLKKTSASGNSTFLGYDDVKRYSFPIFRFVNTGENGIRRMQFKSLITDRHRQFLKALAENDDGDYADVYLEKFTFGSLTRAKGLVDKNTVWHNYIESHNVERPDTGTLREERWGNYCLLDGTEEDLEEKEGDIASMESGYVLYADAINVFLNRMLAPDIENFGVNLPFLKYENLPRFIIYKQGDYLGASQTMTNEAMYRVMSSFVTVNEQLHFTVKGRLYRRPGKFIIVDRGEGDDANIFNTVWLVSSVTHKIENGKYTTDFICNRFFGDKDKAAVGTYYRDSLAKHNVKKTQDVESELTKQSSPPAPAWTGARYDIGFNP